MHFQTVATDAQWQLVTATPNQHYILTFEDIYRTIHSESPAFWRLLVILSRG